MIASLSAVSFPNCLSAKEEGGGGVLQAAKWSAFSLWSLKLGCTVRPNWHTAWCSEIGSLASPDAPEFHASSDVREPISLHQAVHTIAPDFWFLCKLSERWITSVRWSIHDEQSKGFQVTWRACRRNSLEWGPNPKLKIFHWRTIETTSPEWNKKKKFH